MWCFCWCFFVASGIAQRIEYQRLLCILILFLYCTSWLTICLQHFTHAWLNKLLGILNPGLSQKRDHFFWQENLILDGTTPFLYTFHLIYPLISHCELTHLPHGSSMMGSHRHLWLWEFIPGRTPSGAWSMSENHGPKPIKLGGYMINFGDLSEYYVYNYMCIYIYIYTYVHFLCFIFPLCINITIT